MDPGVSQAMVEDDGRTRHLASSNTAVLLHQRTQRIFPVCTAWTAHEDTTNNGGAYSSCDIVGARGSQHNKQMNLGRRSKRLKNDRIERIFRLFWSPRNHFLQQRMVLLTGAPRRRAMTISVRGPNPGRTLLFQDSW